MKKQIPILIVLVTSLVMLAGATPSVAESDQKVTGGIQWRFPGAYGWFEVDIHGADPAEVKGSVNLKEYSEDLGWRRWQGHPICVGFGEGPNGEPAASFVVQIDRISGWGPGEVGQYVKLWGSDCGMSAADGDLAGIVVFPPKDKQPNCDYRRPRAYWPLTGGNLVIHD